MRKVLQIFNNIFYLILWQVGKLLPIHNGKKKLGLLRTDRVGDFILFTPALMYIREKYPNYKIVLIVNNYISDLIEKCPYIDDVILINESRFRKNIVYRFYFLLKIYFTSFSDFIYSCYSRNSFGDLLVLWSGATFKVGWDSNENNLSPKEICKNNIIYSFLKKGDYPPTTHELLRTRDFLKDFEIQIDQFEPTIWVSENTNLPFLEKIRIAKENHSIIIALITEASFSIKKWDGDKFQQLCNLLINDYKNKIKFVLLGTKDNLVVFNINENTNFDYFMDFRGRTSLSDAARILKTCDIAIGLDTGIMHLALALNVPTVCIMGGGQFGRFFPYGENTKHFFLYNKLDCFNCSWMCIYSEPRCITGVSVKVVHDEAMKLLSKTKS